jgi:hypothetical protein
LDWPELDEDLAFAPHAARAVMRATVMMRPTPARRRTARCLIRIPYLLKYGHGFLTGAFLVPFVVPSLRTGH